MPRRIIVAALVAAGTLVMSHTPAIAAETRDDGDDAVAEQFMGTAFDIRRVSVDAGVSTTAVTVGIEPVEHRPGTGETFEYRQDQIVVFLDTDLDGTSEYAVGFGRNGDNTATLARTPDSRQNCQVTGGSGSMYEPENVIATQTFSFGTQDGWRTMTMTFPSWQIGSPGTFRWGAYAHTYSLTASTWDYAPDMANPDPSRGNPQGIDESCDTNGDGRYADDSELAVRGFWPVALEKVYGYGIEDWTPPPPPPPPPAPEPAPEPPPAGGYRVQDVGGEPPETAPYRVQGIEVTQGSQDLGSTTFDRRHLGIHEERYRGVKLAKGGRTVVRVFATAEGMTLGAKLIARRAGTNKLLGQLDPLHRGMPDLARRGAVQKQAATRGGFVFALPPEWAKGTINLTAELSPPRGRAKCEDPQCRPATLSGVQFTPVRPFTIRLVGMSDGTPPEQTRVPGFVVREIRRAVDLVPQGPERVRILPDWAGWVDVSKVKPGSTVCDWWGNCRFRERAEGQIATMEVLNDHDHDTEDPKADFTIGVARFDHFGLQNAAVLFRWQAQNVCAVGGWDSAFTCERPVAQITVGEGRPLTAIAHELFHGLGRPHASKACGGGEEWLGGAIKAGHEDWAPDQRGHLRGVGLDFVSPQQGFYRIIGPESATPFTSSDGVQTTANHDLMSYCAKIGGDELQRVWLSGHNWNWSLDLLTTGRAGTRAALPRAARAPRVRAAQADGPKLIVDAVETAAGVAVERVEPGSGGAVTAGAPQENPRLVVRDANGAAVSDTPMDAVVVHSDGDVAVPMRRLRAAVPAGAAQSIAIVEPGGKVVAERHRSPNAPEVRLLAPMRRTRVGGKGTFRVGWRASDADGDDLLATVELSPDGGRTWRTLYSGPNRGAASFRADMLPRTRKARVRVRVNDGFNETSRVSPRFAAAGRRPSVRLVVPARGERVRAGRVTLAVDAVDDRGRPIAGRRIRWYVGRRRAGNGERVTVRLKRGRHRIRVLAKDRSGRYGSAKRVLRVAR